MRILVISPSMTQDMTDEVGHVAQSAAAPGTVIETTQPQAGLRSIEGNADEVLANYHTLDVVASTRGR
jgi:allantoin racemase